MDESMGDAVVTAIRPVRRSLVPASTLVVIAETVLGGVAALIALQIGLGFSILDPTLWALYTRSFVRGVFGTLGYVALIIPLSVAIGFALGWARISRYRALSWPIAVYVEFFRGVPQLIVVLFAFFLGALLLPGRLITLMEGFGIDVALLMAALALALHSAAFQAEIFRAGFQSVPRAQVEAAEAIGMNHLRAMRHVVLPQALRLSLPPLANELAAVIKDTSILYAVGAIELFALSLEFTQQIPFTPGGTLIWLFGVWTSVALVYFAMTFTMTRLLGRLERKFRVRGLEVLSA